MSGYEGGPGLSLRKSGMRSSSGKVSAMALNADIDPPPTPWRVAPALAVLAVLLFVSLQFTLPATHFRHPADPLRNWIPISELKGRTHDKIDSNFDGIRSPSEGRKGNLIVVMTKEADLRPTLVVLNSIMSNTREPKKQQFYVILPSNVPNSEMLKLGTVFSDLKIEIIRDKDIIKKMGPFIPAELKSERSFKLLDLVPFYLPAMFPAHERFVYLESDAVLQGDLLELMELDMQDNPVAGVEDCSQHFETFFAMSLLEAARLSAGNGKPQLPLQPYEPQTCLLDKGILVIDQKIWRERNITEEVHWWVAMYYESAENLYSNGHVELPVQLALYKKYKGLDASWNVREPLTFAKASVAKLIHFDKQHKPWHQTKPSKFEKDVTTLWWKYLPPSSNLTFDSQ